MSEQITHAEVDIKQARHAPCTGWRNAACCASHGSRFCLGTELDMSFHKLFSFHKVAWRELADWIVQPKHGAKLSPVRARGSLDLNRDTLRHRVHAAKYEDLLK